MGELFEDCLRQCPELAEQIYSIRAGERGYKTFASDATSVTMDGAAIAPERVERTRHTEIAPGTTSARYAPPRKAELESDVIVPAMQSLIAAVCVGLVVLVGALALRANVKLSLELAGGVAALALAYTYIGLMRRHSDATTFVQVIEEITKTDINGDGSIGKPPIIQTVHEPILVNHYGPPPQELFKTFSGVKVPRDDMHLFLSYADQDGLTFEEADRCGLSRDHWDAIIDHTARIGLTTAKSQGVDAKLLVGQDELMRKVFKGD